MDRPSRKRTLIVTFGLLCISCWCLPARATGVRPSGELEGEFTQEELERVTAEIRAEIEELRGEKFKRPVAVAVTDKEGFFAYAQERIEKMTTPEELRDEEMIAKLLGILPPDMDYVETMMGVLEEQVGGFYDPAEEKFYLMSTFTGGLARIILSHELTHALDDQLFDLDGTIETLKDNADELYAFQSVVEGSGTSLMNQWMMANMHELDAGDLMESANSISMESLKDAPPFLWKPLLGAYMCGAAFLARTDNVMQGQMAKIPTEDVHRVFTDPPRSSEQVLHPEKYWDEDQIDLPRAVTIAVGELPDGWEQRRQNTLGEMGLGLCTEPLRKRKGLESQMAAITVTYTNSAARGWDGDRHVLLGKGEARILLSLSVWDDAGEAEQCLEALQKLAPHVAAQNEAHAKLLELEGAGYEAWAGEAEDTLRFMSWVGLSREQAKELASRVTFEVAE